MAELVQRLDPLPAYGTTSHQQDPHLFHRPVACLGDHRRRPREGGSRRRHRIGRIRPTDLTSSLPVGGSTSTTSTSAPAKNRANPTPHDPVPSTPTRDTGPNNQPSSSSKPASSTGNDSIPSNPPLPSTAAATSKSAWVSTPPTTLRTIDMTAPFTRLGQRGGSTTGTAEVTQPSWR